MTIKEKKKTLKGLKIAWIGDGNNVCNSMIFGSALSGVTMSIATPKGFEPNKSTVKVSRNLTDIELTNDPLKAAKNADVVVTDTYSSIHNKDPKRIKKFLPKFQVNDKIMDLAKENAIFLHCLPAKREQEVTSSVIDGSQSVVWDEAENRLHSQKALLSALLHA
jgi:ornithine carbamoyltransferase